MPSRSDFRHHLNHLLVFRLLAVAFVIALIPRADAQDNGITVGQPKVYDGQSLAIMLDQLNTRLQQIQVIDQQSLLKAFGLFQGSQQTDLSRSFDVSVSLTPKAAAATPSSKSSGSSDGTTSTNSGGSSGDSSKSDSSKGTSSSTKDSGSGTA